MREMKDSGIEWIGDIPISWTTNKGKYLFQQRSTKGNHIELQLLSPTQKFGVIPQSMFEELTTNTAVKINEKTDLMTFKTIHRGDYCISLRSFQGGFEYSLYEGVVSPAYTVFFKKGDLCNGYYKYLFKDQSFIKEMNSYTLSLRDGKNISFDDFGNTYLPIPPLAEQEIITDYLDSKCAEIDSLISDIQSQIEALEEYKRSVITEAVTKGLDPDVEMRDSGIDAFELIPKHWEVLKIKWLLRERNERSVLGEEEPLSMSQKFGIIPTSQMDIIPNMASSFVGAKITHIDDLVFNKLKAHLGVFAVSKYYGLVSPDYAVYFTSGKSIVKYLEFLFKTDNCISEFKRRSTGVGAGLTRLYTSDLFDIKVPIPPISEQMEIAKHLDCKISEINLAISEKQQQIETIEEYKKSLIFEYVTGKKEVQ